MSDDLVTMLKDQHRQTMARLDIIDMQIDGFRAELQREMLLQRMDIQDYIDKRFAELDAQFEAIRARVAA